MATPVLGRLRGYVRDTRTRLMEKLPYETMIYDDEYEPYVDSPSSPSSGNLKYTPLEGRQSPRRRLRRSRSPKLLVLLALLVTLILVAVLLAANLRSSSQITSLSLLPSANSTSSTNSTSLRLIVPASTVSDNVCKVLLSAFLLGYPSPTVINYNRTFNNPMLVAMGSHIAKIDGILNHLHTIPREFDNDLVLIIDGLDAWLQLRPSVLIERYYDMNRRADDRIQQQFGRGAELDSIKQDVVFSSQKKCWPGEEHGYSCTAVPESPLPPNLYGSDTDHWIPFSSYPVAHYRNRWLNSGSTMGTVAGVRAIFERARTYILHKDHNHRGSDQGIFADILAEQELWRRMTAAKYQGKGTGAPTPASQNLTAGERYEFGMGLDYEMLLVMATVFCEHDTAWIRYNDPATIANLSQDMGMAHPHVGALPADIARSQLPFAGLANDPALAAAGWADVPLFTNMRTGYTPVAVHHNAHADGAKARLQTMWNETWFQPHARKLLQSFYETPERAVAEVRVAGEEREFWNAPVRGRGVVGTDCEGAEELRFGEACAASWGVLFEGQRDGVEEGGGVRGGLEAGRAA